MARFKADPGVLVRWDSGHLDVLVMLQVNELGLKTPNSLPDE